MKIAGDYTFNIGIDELWQALFDPEVLAASLPGCEKLEIVDGTMLGELKIKIGPIGGVFAGKIDFSEVNKPTSYDMVIDGRGKQGFVKATATVELQEAGDKTRLIYDSDSKVGGKLASVGQRLVGASARAIAKQTLESLNNTLTHRQKAVAEAEAEAEAEADAERGDARSEDSGDVDDDGRSESSKAASPAAARAATKTVAPLPTPSKATFAAGVAKEMFSELVPGWLRVALALAVVGLALYGFYALIWL